MRQWGVDQVLQDIGASDELEDEGGDIRLVSFAHGVPRAKGDEWVGIDQQSYKIDEKVYRYTGTHYTFGLEEVDGGKWAEERAAHLY
jgi:hypothetical protein